VIVGVDPGLDGAIATIGQGGLSLFCTPTVVVKATKRAYDEQEIHRALAKLVGWPGESVHVVIEHVGAMQGQGVTSMFTFGLGFGLLRGICVGLGLPYTLVRPQAWQKLMLAGQPKGSEYLVASRLWPGTDFRKSPRCKIPHEGLVDAALIAEWGRRTLGHA
jgi:crossover junction endodeoxyribonuclease RuvC